MLSHAIHGREVGSIHLLVFIGKTITAFNSLFNKLRFYDYILFVFFAAIIIEYYLLIFRFLLQNELKIHSEATSKGISSNHSYKIILW